MGLGRAARPAAGLGCRAAGAPAGRVAGALGAVAGGARRVRGLPAPDRGPRPVTRKLGGLTRRWRFDRMATVCSPELGRCPRRSPRPRSTTRWRSISARRGTATARAWWRRPTTPPRNAGGAPLPTTRPSPAPRPASTSSARALDGRVRRRDGRERTTVGELAAGEGLRAVPAAAFPAELAVVRTVSRAGAGRLPRQPYSVPPGDARRPGRGPHRSAPISCASSPPPARPCWPAPPRPDRRRRDGPR